KAITGQADLFQSAVQLAVQRHLIDHFRSALSFFLIIRPPPSSTLFPYTTLFRSWPPKRSASVTTPSGSEAQALISGSGGPRRCPDRKSTRLNSSHVAISYAVFCLKKKNKPQYTTYINNSVRVTLYSYHLLLLGCR